MVLAAWNGSSAREKYSSRPSRVRNAIPTSAPLLRISAWIPDATAGLRDFVCARTGTSQTSAADVTITQNAHARNVPSALCLHDGDDNEKRIGEKCARKGCAKTRRTEKNEGPRPPRPWALVAATWRQSLRTAGDARLGAAAKIYGVLHPLLQRARTACGQSASCGRWKDPGKDHPPRSP